MNALGLVGLCLAGVAAAQEPPAPAPEGTAPEGMAPEGMAPGRVAPQSLQAQDPGPTRAAIEPWELRVLALEERVHTLEAQIAAQPVEAIPVSMTWEAPAGVSTASTSGALDRAVLVPAGQVVPQAVAWGGPLHVQGEVLGDAVSLWGDLVVHEGARVGGDAVSLNGRVLVEEGGRVVGNRVNLGGAAPSRPPPSPWTGRMRVGARRLGLALALAAGGVLMVALLPRPIEATARALREGPGRCLISGLTVTGLTLAGGTLLALTLVGLPLAGVLAVALISAWALGFVGLCQVVGDQLPLRQPGAGRWVALFAGVGLLALLPGLPLFTWAGVALVGSVGVGAVVRGRVWSGRARP